MNASAAGSQPIQIVCQPPNSPDFNILDLGFFHSIQSLQSKVMAGSIEELISAVEQSFHNYSSENISDIFLTLQSVFESALAVYGNNDFRIQPRRKYGLTAHAKTSFNLNCDKDTYENVQKYYDQRITPQ